MLGQCRLEKKSKKKFVGACTWLLKRKWPRNESNQKRVIRKKEKYKKNEEKKCKEKHWNFIFFRYFKHFFVFTVFFFLLFLEIFFYQFETNANNRCVHFFSLVLIILFSCLLDSRRQHCNKLFLSFFASVIFKMNRKKSKRKKNPIRNEIWSTLLS